MFESELIQWLSAQLVRYGPGVLFIVCMLETAVFAGLILPVGALIAFSAMLASRGIFSPFEIALVAITGAMVGDQIGFLIGRWIVSSERPARGDIATIWGTALARTDLLVRKRGLLGITVARTVPFVRTVMPSFAGRSGISWLRFFVFDTLGVLLWATIYVGGGFLAGASWRQVAMRYGEEVGAVLILFGGIVVFFLARHWVRRILRRRAARRASQSESPEDG